MELKTPSTYRQVYIGSLTEDGADIKIIENLVKKKKESPIFSDSYLEHEEAPDFSQEQRQMQELLLDLTCLNDSVIEAKDYLVSIIEKIDGTAEIVEEVAAVLDEKFLEMAGEDVEETEDE